MRKRVLCMLATTMVLAATAYARDLTSTVDVAIEAQPLASALLKFAEQTGMQVVTAGADVRNLHAPQVSGRTTVGAALEKLLDGSGLSFKLMGENTVGLMRETAAAVTNETAAVATAKDPIVLAQAAEASGAQTAAPIAPGDTPSELAELEEIVVTGTHIRGVAPGSSPLRVYTREDIERSGASSLDKFFRSLPENYAGIESNTVLAGGTGLGTEARGSNITAGAAIDLHGVGPNATLVLINGHRLAPSGTEGSYVDISLIPLAAVERVEVLTDGASSIYGAEAIGGVVNFVLRRNFDGFDTRLRYGDSTQGGGREYGGSLSLGHSWANGGIMATYEHADQDPILLKDRSFITPTPFLSADDPLTPLQRRNSAFVTAHHTLAAGTELLADLLVSRRYFQQTQNTGFTFDKSDGDETSIATTFGLNQRLGVAWRAEIVAGYSRSDQDRTTRSESSFPGFPPFTDVLRSTPRSTALAFDARADGPLQFIGNGVRASIGAHQRREEFVNLVRDEFERDVSALYGEVFIPLLGSSEEGSRAQQLDLSLSGRYDHYSGGVGSATTGKAGLLWSPVNGVKLRGTYATSFRAPTLANLSDDRTYQASRLPNSDDPDGQTNTIVVFSLGNPVLDPETSDSFTLGLDYEPTWAKGLRFSATYFNIDYEDRIAAPPVVNFAFLHEEKATLAPFLDYTPAEIFVAEAFASPQFFNSSPSDIVVPADIEAVFDDRIANIGKSTSKGLDLSLNYALETRFGDLSPFVSVTRLFESSYQAVATTPVVDLLDLAFFPTNFRARGGTGWSYGQISSQLTVRYVDDYRNSLVVPNTGIDSWTTFDLSLSYRSPDMAVGLLRGTTVMLNVENVTDEEPPSVVGSFSLGYDPMNASERGRFISVSLQKDW